MNARDRVYAGLRPHDRGMQPRFERRGLAAFDDFTFQIHREKVVLRDQVETDSGRHQEKVGGRDTSADMAECFDEFLRARIRQALTTSFFSWPIVSILLLLKMENFTLYYVLPFQGKSELRMKN